MEIKLSIGTTKCAKNQELYKGFVMANLPSYVKAYKDGIPASEQRYIKSFVSGNDLKFEDIKMWLVVKVEDILENIIYEALEIHKDKSFDITINIE